MVCTKGSIGLRLTWGGEGAKLSRPRRAVDSCLLLGQDTMIVPKFRSPQPGEEGPRQTLTASRIATHKPPELLWDEFDLDDEDFHCFLDEHYDEAFCLKPRTRKWLLNSPETPPSWRICLRESTGRIVGTIAGVPCVLQTPHSRVEGARINFLCVREEMRGRGLTRILIQEMTRRVVATGRQIGIHMGAPISATSVSQVRLWQRCIDSGGLGEGDYQEFRSLSPAELTQASAILQEYRKGFGLTDFWGSAEMAHWLGVPTAHEQAAYTLVGGSPITGLVSGFRASVGKGDHWPVFMLTLLVGGERALAAGVQQARRLGCKTIFCFNMADRGTALKKLGFQPCDDFIHIYIYNWSGPERAFHEVSLLPI